MSSPWSLTVLLKYFTEQIYRRCRVDVLLLELPLGSCCVLPFCIFLFYFPPLCLVFLLVILNLWFLSSSLRDSVFPFFIWLHWISISGRDVLFQKLSMFRYLLPFSSLYFGSSKYVCLYQSPASQHLIFLLATMFYWSMPIFKQLVSVVHQLVYF